MEYKILKVNFPDCEEGRFYRTFAVRNNINLKDLGCAILTAFLSNMKSDYYFTNGLTRYLPQHLRMDYFEEDKLISDYTLEVLPDKFLFHYGFDEYEFECSVINTEERGDFSEVILLDGAGQGIWEGCYFTLRAYLRGDLDPMKLEEDYFNDIFIPENVKLTKYGDFDTSFDLDTIQECFYGLYTLRLELLDTKKEESMHYDIITKVIDHHRNIYDFVEEKYLKLINKYSHIDVYSMLYSVFIDIAVDCAELDIEFDSEKYKNEISKVK